MNKKAVIFDLNGVFIISPKLSDRFLEDHGVSNEEFLPVLKEIMNKIRMPNAEGVYSYWKPHLKKWNVKLTEREFLDYWFNAEKENPAMLNLARELKKQNVLLFVLSNNFRERAEYYTQKFLFLNELFEKVYYSWQTGFIKPDVRAYELILKENDLKPESCVYFDDSETNVEAANNLRIKSHLFISAGDVKEKLLNSKVL